MLCGLTAGPRTATNLRNLWTIWITVWHVIASTAITGIQIASFWISPSEKPDWRNCGRWSGIVISIQPAPGPQPETSSLLTGHNGWDISKTTNKMTAAQSSNSIFKIVFSPLFEVKYKIQYRISTRSQINIADPPSFGGIIYGSTAKKLVNIKDHFDVNHIDLTL